MEFCLKAEWKAGHSETVLTLGVNTVGVVASGGEEGDVCFWKLDGQMVSKKAFPSKSDVNSICFSPKQPSLAYISVGEAVEVLDVRCLDSSIARFTFNKEDINQLAIDRRDAFLAACDDDGIIKIIDLQSHKVFRTLKGHNNICSSVAFHPSSPREIISGGLDCFLHAWEVTRGRPLTSVNMQELLLESADDHRLGPYMINPPFIHSVDFSSSGDLLACGLENARIQLLERKGKRTLTSRGSLQGHTQGVTQVCFVPGSPGYESDLLLSAGNDCGLVLWATGSDDVHPLEKTSPCEELAKKAEDAKTRADESASSVVGKRPKLQVKHKNKINRIMPVCSSGGANMVLVADVSKNISVYQW